MLLLCEWTRPLWFGLQITTPPSPLGLTTIQRWIVDALESPMRVDNNLSTWIFFSLWTIWNARNDKVFNNKTPNPLSSLHKIKTQCNDFLSVKQLYPDNNHHQHNVSTSNVQAPPTQWRPPRDCYVKVNCDSAFDQTTGKGFTGIICRDAQGNLLTAASTRCYASSPIVAEALSLRDAVSFAVNIHLEQAIFESDNKTLVDVCNERSEQREIQGIVEDINSLRMNLQNSEITWIKREGNQCAHTIALLAKEDALHGTWMLLPPPLLRRALVADAQALWS